MSTPLEQLADVHIAAAAADAARATPGVERLQPGLWGLVQQLSRELWQHATGEPYPDVAGVEVELADGPTGVTARVDVTLATDGTLPAAAVAAAVQRAVAAAVAARTAVPVVSVAVHVCEIALPR